MPGIMQEKFQVDNAPNANDDARTGWKSDSSARRTRTAPSGSPPLPPGMNIASQAVSPARSFPTVTSGESDISADFNAPAARNGFKRLPMSGTEDEYSNAHVDSFYDEIKVDGDVGFAERNNMLDRM
jgi:hypothetical protein